MMQYNLWCWYPVAEHPPERNNNFVLPLREDNKMQTRLLSFYEYAAVTGCGVVPQDEIRLLLLDWDIQNNEIRTLFS